MKCKTCRLDCDDQGMTEFDEDGKQPTEDYDPEDGRCFGCFLAFCYDMYGGWMEPVFMMNGEPIDPGFR